MSVRFPVVLDPYTRERFRVEACGACGLGRTAPRPGNLAPYYPTAYYGSRHGATAAYCMRRRLRLVRACGKPGRLLDVGCGDGSFLLAARRAGWRVCGTEMNMARAKNSGLHICKNIQETEVHGPFDCITLWHVLEHLPDPAAEIEFLAGLLAPGGTLLVAVPNAGGWQARLFGHRWFALDVPRHQFHFTRGSLEVLFGQAGLRTERRWHQELEYDVFGWVQSLLNCFRNEPNRLFNRLMHAGPISTDYALAVPLTLLALPGTWLSSAVGSGGTIILAARRPAGSSRRAA